jgi:hypothetical protein
MDLGGADLKINLANTITQASLRKSPYGADSDLAKIEKTLVAVFISLYYLNNNLLL